MSVNKVRLGDTELNVRQEGAGPPLLLVHGFPLDHSMWEAQVAEFQRDHLVIAPDLRGFGGSGLGTERLTMAQLADDLARLLDELGVHAPLVFCGLSMGGYVAWQFWDRHADRLAKLVICDSRAAADLPAAAEGRRKTAEDVLREGTAALITGMLPKLFAAPTLEAGGQTVESVRRVMQATDPQTVAAALLAMAERPSYAERLGNIAVPTLLLGGEHDLITPAAEMRQIAGDLPDARFEEIADAGHMAPVEQAAAVNRVLRSFIQQ